jgi:hypothetical protein
MQDVQEVSACMQLFFWYTSDLCPVYRFESSTDVSGFNQAKSSVVRGVRAKLLDLYPPLADYMDDIIPKKEPVQVIKW